MVSQALGDWENRTNWIEERGLKTLRRIAQAEVREFVDYQFG